MIIVGCPRCTYPSIHLFVSKPRSVVRGAVVCCVHEGVVWCVAWCVWCVVLVLVLVFGGGVVWCCVVWCGVVWCGVYLCLFVLFFLFFLSIFFLFLLVLSLSLSFFSILSSLLSSLFSSAFSSLFSSRHQTLWKEPINQHGGQHRGIWMWSGAGQVHSSRFSPSSSPLPPPFSPSPPQTKEEETFYYRNSSGEGMISHYSFILIQKNRRRVKSQSLQFYISSKTIKLQRVKSVIILAAMVSSQSGERLWSTRWSYWYKETYADHPKPRGWVFSSEDTGKCWKFRFLETVRSGGSFKLYLYKETSQEVVKYSRLLKILNGRIKDKCVDMGTLHVFVSESSHSFWTELFGEPGSLQEHELREIQSLFNITQKLKLQHSEEILNVNTIDSASPSWTRSVLSHDEVIQWKKQKNVFTHTPHNAKWRWMIAKMGIDGEAIEFEWNTLPKISSLQILQKILDDLRDRNSKPEEFTDRIIFMSMFSTTSIGQEKEMMKFVFRIQKS